MVVVLLALGALPSYLRSGAPYHVTATPVGEDGPAVDATVLSERHFPYTTGGDPASTSARSPSTDAKP